MDTAERIKEQYGDDAILAGILYAFAGKVANFSNSEFNRLLVIPAVIEEIKQEFSPKIVDAVIEWLKPYLKDGYGVGCYTEGKKVLEWVICDSDGDAIDAPNFTLVQTHRD